MGQWFRVVNLDKREWFDPRDLGGEARLLLCCDPGIHLADAPEEDPEGTPGRPLLDTAVNAAGLLAFLLRSSDRFGGGDVGHRIPRLDLTGLPEEEATRRLEEVSRQNEDVPFNQKVGPVQWCGRWAGDRITIVGDYDSGRLFHRLEKPGAGWRHIGAGPLGKSLALEYARLVVEPYVEAEMQRRQIERLRAVGHAVERRRIVEHRLTEPLPRRPDSPAAAQEAHP